MRDLVDAVPPCVDVLQKGVELVGELVQPVEDEVDLVRGDRLPDLGELQRDQTEQSHLRGERLRRGDADLEPAARVEHRLRLARDLRPHHVRDRERVRAALAGELDRVDGVTRLARLRDPDDERVLRQHGIAVDPLARDIGLDRQSRPLLHDVPADDARVVRRAAGDDDDTAEIADLLLVEPEAVEHEMPVTDTVADRLAHRLRLLVDLLEHERLVTALLGRLVVPVDRNHVGRAAVRAVELRAGRRDRDDVPVVREHDAVGMGEKRDDGRREEHLAVADADDEGSLAAHADEQVGMVVVDDDEGEVALESRVDVLHGLGEIVAGGEPLLDQVRHDLGVGLGDEGVPLGGQLVAELAIVLDDPVQDDRDLLRVAARQRMCVLFRDAAVRRPARVAEAVVRQRAVLAGGLFQVLEVADRADVVESAGLTQRDPGRVVASVLEALEALEEQRLRRTGTDVPDDPTHVEPPFAAVTARPRFPWKSGPRNAQSPACRATPAPEWVSRALERREPRSYHRGFPLSRSFPPPREP